MRRRRVFVSSSFTSLIRLSDAHHQSCSSCPRDHAVHRLWSRLSGRHTGRLSQRQPCCAGLPVLALILVRIVAGSAPDRLHPDRDPGFDPRDVLVGGGTLVEHERWSHARRRRVGARTLNRVPGVRRGFLSPSSPSQSRRRRDTGTRGLVVRVLEASSPHDLRARRRGLYFGPAKHTGMREREYHPSAGTAVVPDGRLPARGRVPSPPAAPAAR